jgi:hypothetical protein
MGHSKGEGSDTSGQRTALRSGNHPRYPRAQARLYARRTRAALRPCNATSPACLPRRSTDRTSGARMSSIRLLSEYVRPTRLGSSCSFYLPSGSRYVAAAACQAGLHGGRAVGQW